MSARVRYVVTAAPPAVTTPADLAGLSPAADWIELRLDLLPVFEPASFEAWVRASPRPLLVTLRSKAQGGRADASPREIAAMLADVARLGVAAVDVEADVLPHLDDLPDDVEVVHSVHARRPQRGDASGLWKLALPVDDADGWARARTLHASVVGTRAFVVPYGSLGHARGAFVDRSADGLVYGGPDEPCEGIDGQPGLRDLLDELRVGEVDPAAAMFALCGAPPSRSPSPAMHNAVFRFAQRNALYVPLPGLDLARAADLGLHGLSVTTPWKQAAYELADDHDASARDTGAANTLVRRGSGWNAANTDVAGLVDCLPESEPGQSAFVYGAGGFARAAIVALRQRGYEVRIGARDASAGRVLAAGTDATWCGTRYERRDADRVVLNATPAGADGGPVTAFAGTALSGLCVVDAPYRDAGPTGLVSQARDGGCDHVVDGFALLAAQAVHQARLFTPGLDEADVERVVAFAVRVPTTLILVGTRGAGKTTVGRGVARRLGRPFVDLDEEVQRTTGRSPAEWIAGDGWEAFRDEEQRLFARALDRRGVVLATGGGIVEREVNRDALRAHAIVVHLDVDAQTAAARLRADPGVRPRWRGARTLDEECETLIERRQAWWRACARHVVDARLPMDQVIERVSRRWFEGGRAAAR